MVLVVCRLTGDSPDNHVSFYLILCSLSFVSLHVCYLSPRLLSLLHPTLSNLFLSFFLKNQKYEDKMTSSERPGIAG